MGVKLRSPNYPTINLETAIEQLRKLYSRVRMDVFVARDAASAWDYNSVSGPVKSILAAFRQYGLLEGKVRGKNAENPRISRRGLTLIRRNQTSREFQDELKNAALAPPLFKELYNSQSNATDEVLRDHLLYEKSFTENGAQRFIEVYRATLEFAKLNKDLDMTGSYYDDSAIEQETDLHESDHEIAHDSRQPEMVKIPLSTEGEYARLKSGMSLAEWNLRIKLIEAYKEMLVQDDTEPTDSTSIGNAKPQP